MGTETFYNNNRFPNISDILTVVKHEPDFSNRNISITNDSIVVNNLVTNEESISGIFLEI